MSELLPQLATAFGLGLLGSGHCLGMCGGIAAATGSGDKNYSVYFNLGRVSSYALIGLLLGGLTQVISANLAPMMLVFRVVAGLLLVAMGLYLGTWWMGLTKLERAGHFIWRKVQPLTRQFLPIESAGNAIKLGLLWGLLPCGLIYSTLTWAATSANAISSMLLMLAFGLGTLPAMLGIAWFGAKVQQFMRNKFTRSISAASLIIFGLWTMVTPIQHYQMHCSHSQSSASDSEMNSHQHH
jgi:sulfite exporter TauE/SafE|tara:strand:+ start:8888 stop:9607 length:720 start_codon:yes stop_codon:yes gene_type:complete